MALNRSSSGYFLGAAMLLILPWIQSLHQTPGDSLVQLTGKVRRRIESTRGIFVSMAGFRSEVTQLYRLSHEQRLVLVDGQDLALILEGRIELPDALRAKVEARGRFS